MMLIWFRVHSVREVVALMLLLGSLDTGVREYRISPIGLY